MASPPGVVTGLVDRLRTWGYKARPATDDAWAPAPSADAVYFHPGLRRAALSLAGDLGLPASAVVADPGSTAPLTLVVR